MKNPQFEQDITIPEQFILYEIIKGMAEGQMFAMLPFEVKI
jgi:hypothetical protein